MSNLRSPIQIAKSVAATGYPKLSMCHKDLLSMLSYKEMVLNVTVDLHDALDWEER